MTPTNDLTDFMNSATQEIENEYIRIQKRALEDPGTAGDQGEENWATLLRNWLPSNFQIVTKGRILSHKGIASPQVDVIVLQPEYPKHLLDKKLYLAGGVLAAFECKLTLRTKHIEKFLSNSREIREHIIERKGSPYKELNSGLIYGLLAHSHSWKEENSKPIENIENNLWKQDGLIIKHPKQIPDILCVADLATWTSTKVSFVGPNQIPNWEGMKEMYGENGSASSGYICQSKKSQDQNENFTPIGSMIVNLMNKIAWEYPTLRNLANYFRATDISGTGAGTMRTWKSEIYSDEIRNKVERGMLSNGKWDEWSLVFS